LHHLRSAIENINHRLKEWAFFSDICRDRSDTTLHIAAPLRVIVVLTDYLLQTAPVRALIRRFAHPKPKGE
jgi:hypothetical protein